MKWTVQDSTTRFSTSSFFKIKLEKVCKKPLVFEKMFLEKLVQIYDTRLTGTWLIGTWLTGRLYSGETDSPGCYTLGRLTRRAVILWGDWLTEVLYLYQIENILARGFVTEKGLILICTGPLRNSFLQTLCASGSFLHFLSQSLFSSSQIGLRKLYSAISFIIVLLFENLLNNFILNSFAIWNFTQQFHS